MFYYLPRDVPQDQRQANPETVKRVRSAVAQIVENERRRRHAEGLMRAWDLDRDGLDKAAVSLGIPPVSDEEWTVIQAARRSTHDAATP
ncbi:hypothetical protein [Sphaerisporangium fuscum]|uniref:hypothetical protein n=1 Tax=Sphaerisporangium fuscum TaxID=2835868 RepID=UPI001BDCE0EC|nr:hypothetical protein [Sphaerisporangium fuscum]